MQISLRLRSAENGCDHLQLYYSAIAIFYAQQATMNGLLQ